jgi:flagellar assembly protein FliH
MAADLAAVAPGASVGPAQGSHSGADAPGWVGGDPPTAISVDETSGGSAALSESETRHGAAALSGYPLEQLEPSADSGRWDSNPRARILADATAEAERIRALARAEGHTEGLAQGREDGLSEARSAASALRQALTEALALREQLVEETERDAVALALALAAKILAGTLEVQPERVLDTVRGALRRVTDRRRVTVLVDPCDLETVSAAIAELGAQVGGVEHCDVQADRRVGRGGAIVRTLESEVDTTVETQLERAREVIQAELGGAEAPPGGASAPSEETA